MYITTATCLGFFYKPSSDNRLHKIYVRGEILFASLQIYMNSAFFFKCTTVKNKALKAEDKIFGNNWEILKVSVKLCDVHYSGLNIL
jgi:hypothetical protein